jgi:DNA mismatch repair protein MutL
LVGIDDVGVRVRVRVSVDVDRPAPPKERERSVKFDEGRWQAEGASAGDASPEWADDTGGEREHEHERDSHRRFSEQPAQATLGPDEGTVETPEFDRLAAMRVLGQYDDTYPVAETDDGLLLIDQHAADERVNYEALRERFQGDVATQTLVSPVEVELTAREADLFEANQEALSRLGFRASLVDDRTVAVRTVPAMLADTDAPELVRDLLADLVSGDPTETVSEAVDHLLGDMACYPVIKGNESLTEGSVVSLLEALDACKNPYACLHGRPVLLEFSRAEIEDRFERDYPGHQMRRE